jgi:hypothetical protein
MVLENTCGNIRCINPHHLRARPRLSKTKVSWDTAAEIRGRYCQEDISQRTLSTQYKISIKTINKIVNGKPPYEDIPKIPPSYYVYTWYEAARIAQMYHLGQRIPCELADKYDADPRRVYNIIRKPDVDYKNLPTRRGAWTK